MINSFSRKLKQSKQKWSLNFIYLHEQDACVVILLGEFKELSPILYYIFFKILLGFWESTHILFIGVRYCQDL